MPSRHPAILLFSLALVILSASFTAACGGDRESPASSEEVAAVNDSVARSRAAGTAKVLIVLEVPGAKDTEPLHFTGSGSIDFTGPREHLSMNVGGFTSEVIHDGAVAYSRMGMPGAISANATWYRSNAANAAAALATTSFGVPVDDPLKVLEMVLTAHDIRSAGTEQLRGGEAKHYRVTTSTNAEFEVWLDANGRVAKVRHSVSGSTSDAPRATLTTEFHDYGVAVAITAPPAERVQAMPETPPASRPVLVGQK